MDDWFSQNAPKPQPAAGDDWFASHAAAAAPAGDGMLEKIEAGLRSLYEMAKAHPVGLAAAAGSAAAVPLTGGASLLPMMAAAGLGAAGGAGAAIAGRQLATGTPESATNTLKTMATEGAAGAAGEGIGSGIVKPALQGAAKLVYKTALRPGLPLQREFGDLAGKGLSEGVPVSGGGYQQTSDALRASSDKARQLIAQAAPTAPPVRVVTEAARDVPDLVQRAGTRADTGLPDESPAIVARVKGMVKANPGGIPLERAQEMKGELQDLASRVYRAQDKGAPVLDLGADTNASLARGLRGAIEQRVPGLSDVNSHTQDLIGLQRAIENATMRNVPGVGSIRSLLGDFMPATASRVAIGADRAAPYGPLVLRALLAAMGGGGQ